MGPTPQTQPPVSADLEPQPQQLSHQNDEAQPMDTSEDKQRDPQSQPSHPEPSIDQDSKLGREHTRSTDTDQTPTPQGDVSPKLGRDTAPQEQNTKRSAAQAQLPERTSARIKARKTQTEAKAEFAIVRKQQGKQHNLYVVKILGDNGKAPISVHYYNTHDTKLAQAKRAYVPVWIVLEAHPDKSAKAATTQSEYWGEDPERYCKSYETFWDQIPRRDIVHRGFMLDQDGQVPKDSIGYSNKRYAKPNQ